MANDLTGDFDVVAQFAIPAVNRVLAAMHRCERFPHSLAIRVDDDPPPGSRVLPTIVASVDAFGDATVSHNRIPTRSDLLGQVVAADALRFALDPAVNPGVVGPTVGPVTPSRFRGRAQLQLFPPTIEVADASGSNIAVKLPLMARYFPDPHTPPAPEFVRGELRITAPVNQVASQEASVIDVDIKAAAVVIHFTPAWSSRPLSSEDLAGINLLIRNALKTSFLPSSAPLPSSVQHMQFKTLLGAHSAIAVLLNMEGARGNPASLNNVFLGPGDPFAFAAGRDFLLGNVAEAVGNLPGQQFRVEFDIDWPWPVPNQHAVYAVSLNHATVDLQNGKIVLTIGGRAETASWNLPNFDFTAKQALTLRLVATTPGGSLNTAELALLGDISLDTSSWVANLFKGGALPTIRARRDTALSEAQDRVRGLLSAETNLGEFLKSLLKPAEQKPGAPPLQELRPVLAYTSIEIKPSGLVLHGSLAVPDWPQPHVEFETIPASSGAGILPGDFVPSGPDYTALKTWIPGGTIERYEWSYKGQTQPFHTEVNRFVLLHPEPGMVAAEASEAGGTGFLPPDIFGGVASTGAVTGFTPLCLTVKGTRIAPSGPAVDHAVSGTVCGYTRVTVLDDIAAGLDNGLLLVALTQPGPGGRVEVTGHASARPDGTGAASCNRIVHFADGNTAGRLGFLTQALRETRRADAATAVVAVLAPGQLATARYTEGVIYAEEQAGAWERAFGVKTARRPLTLIVEPNGHLVWKHEGELDSETLAAALRKHLAPAGPVRPRILGLNLRIGQRPPNFLFELAPGRDLTLRKLAGRPAILVFWKSLAKPSLEAVRDLDKPSRPAGGQRPVVLAINDGEEPEVAKKVAAANALSATLVTDPERRICLAYGVNIWPTTVFIEADGRVREIRYGRLAAAQMQPPAGEKAAAAR